MASKIPNGGGYVKLDFKGMGELLKSKEIGDLLMKRMSAVAAALPGSTLELRQRRTRVAAVVARGSDFDEANTGDLSRALDLSGGLRGTQIQTRKARRR
jgi:hypothetical protein